MTKQIIFGLVLSFMLNGLHAQTTNLESLLFELPDVIFKKISADENLAVYELKIKQAVDHSDESKGFFYQKVYLTHVGFNRPMVIVTEGYNRDQNRIYELTELINANQLDVEHRYFGESMPEPLDYTYLNLEQATTDLHHIKALFSKIYKEKWISTGISKGGATSIFYKYFYPKDVVVSVPYVAPINNAFEDQRIYTFLDTVGTKKCRKKIESFQNIVLTKRENILPLIKMYSIGARENFTYLNFAQAFELTVLEYPFSFWQYGHDCSKIPDKNASNVEVATHLLSVSDISFFSDNSMKTYGSHYYQSATEMGYYGYETAEFKGLLSAFPADKNPHATFLPNKMNATFNGKLLLDVNKWLDREADDLLYIYGSIDTWSATAVRPNQKIESEWFFMDGKHHGNARIANMNAKDKERFIIALEKRLETEIK